MSFNHIYKGEWNPGQQSETLDAAQLRVQAAYDTANAEEQARIKTAFDTRSHEWMPYMATDHPKVLAVVSEIIRELTASGI